MTASVDLTDLRTMTDGDPELEQALFAEFFSSSEHLIQTMAENSSDEAQETWRGSAHALKGSSYNLGATKLGDLCKQAQDNPAMPASNKKQLVDAIRAEYQSVRSYLEQVHS